MGVNVDRWSDWARRRIYLMIHEYILEDFVPQPDCRAIHAEGNMIAGTYPVTHTIARGGQNTYGQMKLADYRQELQRGTSTLDSATETGETGSIRGSGGN